MSSQSTLVLQVKDGKYAGAQISLDKVVTIGSAACDVRLAAPGVGRPHVTFARDRFRPLAPMFLNGGQVSPHEVDLAEGSLISIGERSWTLRRVDKVFSLTSSMGVHARLTEASLLVGRHEAAHIELESTTCSRIHASLRILNGQCEVTDHGSQHGTFVGFGRVVPSVPTRLSDGDRIEMGKAHISVLKVPQSLIARFIAGPAAGRIVELRDVERVTFGRGDEADVTMVDEGGVSRTHLEVKVGAQWCDLEDKSTNGVWVNDAKIGSEPLRLTTPAKVRIGAHLIELHTTHFDLHYDGESGKTTRLVPQREFLIGSDGSCDLRLPESDAQPFHATLTHADGVWLRDLGTDGGTLVNGETVLSNLRSVPSRSRLTFGAESFELSASAYELVPNSPRDPVIPIPIGTTVIGASWLCDARLHNVDPLQCTLVVDETGVITLRHLGGERSTMVNNEELGPRVYPIKLGDELDIGDVAVEVIEIEKPRPCLAIIEGPNAGLSYPLDAGEVPIGRGLEMSIVLDDLQAKDHHATLVVEDTDEYFVRDEHSGRGVFINGKRIVGSALQARDQIAIGTTLMQLRDPLVVDVVPPQRWVPEDDETPIEGPLAEIPLVDAIRILAQRKASGRLSIVSARTSSVGEVRVQDGLVVDAKITPQRLQPIRALLRMASWTEGTVRFEAVKFMRKAAPIDESLDEILAKCAEYVDALTSLGASVPRTSETLRVAQNAPVAGLPAELANICSLVSRHALVGSILNKLDNDLVGLRHIMYLKTTGILVSRG